MLKLRNLLTPDNYTDTFLLKNYTCNKQLQWVTHVILPLEEAETGGFKSYGQPWTHRETMSQKPNQRITKEKENKQEKSSILRIRNGVEGQL